MSIFTGDHLRREYQCIVDRSHKLNGLVMFGCTCLYLVLTQLSYNIVEMITKMTNKTSMNNIFRVDSSHQKFNHEIINDVKTYFLVNANDKHCFCSSGINQNRLMVCISWIGSTRHISLKMLPHLFVNLEYCTYVLLIKLDCIKTSAYFFLIDDTYTYLCEYKNHRGLAAMKVITVNVLIWCKHNDETDMSITVFPLSEICIYFPYLFVLQCLISVWSNVGRRTYTYRYYKHEWWITATEGSLKPLAPKSSEEELKDMYLGIISVSVQTYC